jgi:hypothetical protein
VTNRVYLQTTYGFDLGVHHTAMLNASSSVRKDHTARKQNVSNQSVTLALASQFSVPLQTELSLALNLNDLPASSNAPAHKFNYTVLSLHGRYELLPNTVTCTATMSPTFGDVARTVLDGGLEWHISSPMTLSIQASTFTGSDTASESFLSIRYRYDL